MMHPDRRLPRRRPLVRAWNRLLGREDGNATVEFAILFPVFMLMFMVVFELGLMMTRYMMFDRALDISVRAVRLSENRNFTENDMKQMLCNQTVILNNHCMEDVRLEMVRLNGNQNWSIDPDDVTCRDTTLPGNLQPVTQFDTGVSNDVLFVQACIAMEPFFVDVGLGKFLLRNASNGKLYMIAKSALSVEPVT